MEPRRIILHLMRLLKQDTAWIIGIHCFMIAHATDLQALDIPDLRWMPEPLRAATLRHQSVDFESWSFSLQRTTPEGPTFETYDLKKPLRERWQLWMIDGHPPSSDRLIEYHNIEKPDGASLLRPLGIHLFESRNLETRNSHNDLNPGIHNRDIIGRILFRTDEETADYVQYQVDLTHIELEISNQNSGEKRSSRNEQDNAYGLRELMQNLECYVRVRKDPSYIEYFELRSGNEFAPMAGVRINTFEVRTEYTTVDPDGTPLIHRMKFRLSGKALGFIPFTIRRDVQFSDYEWNPSPESKSAISDSDLTQREKSEAVPGIETAPTENEN